MPQPISQTLAKNSIEALQKRNAALKDEALRIEARIQGRRNSFGGLDFHSSKDRLELADRYSQMKQIRTKLGPVGVSVADRQVRERGSLPNALQAVMSKTPRLLTGRDRQLAKEALIGLSQGGRLKDEYVARVIDLLSRNRTQELRDMARQRPVQSTLGSLLAPKQRQDLGAGLFDLKAQQPDPASVKAMMGRMKAEAQQKELRRLPPELRARVQQQIDSGKPGSYVSEALRQTPGMVEHAMEQVRKSGVRLNNRDLQTVRAFLMTKAGRNSSYWAANEREIPAKTVATVVQLIRSGQVGELRRRNSQEYQATERYAEKERQRRPEHYRKKEAAEAQMREAAEKMFNDRAKKLSFDPDEFATSILRGHERFLTRDGKEIWHYDAHNEFYKVMGFEFPQEAVLKPYSREELDMQRDEWNLRDAADDYGRHPAHDVKGPMIAAMKAKAWRDRTPFQKAWVTSGMDFQFGLLGFAGEMAQAPVEMAVQAVARKAMGTEYYADPKLRAEVEKKLQDSAALKTFSKLIGPGKFVKAANAAQLLGGFGGAVADPNVGFARAFTNHIDENYIDGLNVFATHDKNGKPIGAEERNLRGANVVFTLFDLLGKGASFQRGRVKSELQKRYHVTAQQADEITNMASRMLKDERIKKALVAKFGASVNEFISNKPLKQAVDAAMNQRKAQGAARTVPRTGETVYGQGRADVHGNALEVGKAALGIAGGLMGMNLGRRGNSQRAGNPQKPTRVKTPPPTTSSFDQLFARPSDDRLGAGFVSAPDTYAFPYEGPLQKLLKRDPYEKLPRQMDLQTSGTGQNDILSLAEIERQIGSAFRRKGSYERFTAFLRHLDPRLLDGVSMRFMDVLIDHQKNPKATTFGTYNTRTQEVKLSRLHAPGMNVQDRYSIDIVRTLVHELSHHFEKFMKKEDRDLLRKQFQAERAHAQNKGRKGGKFQDYASEELALSEWWAQTVEEDLSNLFLKKAGMSKVHPVAKPLLHVWAHLEDVLREIARRFERQHMPDHAKQVYRAILNMQRVKQQ